MPAAVACPIILTASDRHRLKKAAYGHKTEHQARMRAHIVLHAARGRSDARIAAETPRASRRSLLDEVEVLTQHRAHAGVSAVRPGRSTTGERFGRGALPWPA